ncbi:hypothetical protein EOI86_23360 [Hwanghaeella grinnelliae]|uniref:HPt domain-containing protein n=1 Tax=Hwanghaeella grinnelliae TaxID=2500179 RepID=A0A437QHL7_9PROT|nr:Hpt domain-containing protein [Hwanghaeella grinnelliae]RVU34058.1 hypothetical protein EOI86_23360 [Hwanghaeella grinnelliae]
MNATTDQAFNERSRRQSGISLRKPKQEMNSASGEELFEGLDSMDKEKIAGLHKVFAAADFRSLIEMVHKCISTELASVEDSLSRQDVGTAMIAAHKITGSSGNYALNKVSKSAAKLSDALSNGGRDDVDSALADLRTHSHAAIIDLEALLSRLPA